MTKGGDLAEKMGTLPWYWVMWQKGVCIRERVLSTATGETGGSK